MLISIINTTNRYCQHTPAAASCTLLCKHAGNYILYLKSLHKKMYIQILNPLLTYGKVHRHKHNNYVRSHTQLKTHMWQHFKLSVSLYQSSKSRKQQAICETENSTANTSRQALTLVPLPYNQSLPETLLWPSFLNECVCVCARRSLSLVFSVLVLHRPLPPPRLCSGEVFSVLQPDGYS